MATRVRQTITKTRVKKDGTPNKAGYMRCHICGGTGVQKVGKRKKR